MAEKKEDVSQVSYILGIVSIVLAFFTPLAGLIFGVVGLVLGKKENTGLAKKGVKLNTIGIIVSVIILIVVIIFSALAPNLLENFPVQ
jgi:hypothetical protein